jgi:hypothetical protein
MHYVFKKYPLGKIKLTASEIQLLVNKLAGKNRDVEFSRSWMI